MANKHDEIGAPYLVVDEDEEQQFCADPDPVLTQTTKELDEASVDDGYRVAVYKLVKVYGYRRPQPKGVLEPVKY